MKVFISRPIPETGLKKLQEAGLEIQLREQDSPIAERELAERIAGVEGVFSLLNDPLNASVLSKANKLRVVGQMGAGLDNIDLALATQKKIAVCHTPGTLTEATADFTFALLLAAARKVIEGDRMVREGKFTGWGPQILLGSSVYGKPIGIIGMGKIGAAVARRARGFDMPVLYTSRTRKGRLESHLGIQWQPFETILREVEFLCIHLPGGAETFHRIGEKELRLMKKSSILINMSRGGVVDDAALVQALKEKRIAAAALDVFEGEPKIHPELLKLDNVVLAPHAGSATRETRDRMAASAAEQIVAVLQGKTPSHCANPEVLS